MDGDSGISDQENYVIVVTAGATGIGSSYVVTARAQAGTTQAKDDGCTQFTLNSLGVRTPDREARLSPDQHTQSHAQRKVPTTV